MCLLRYEEFRTLQDHMQRKHSVRISLRDKDINERSIERAADAHTPRTYRRRTSSSSSNSNVGCHVHDSHSETGSYQSAAAGNDNQTCPMETCDRDTHRFPYGFAAGVQSIACGAWVMRDLAESDLGGEQMARTRFRAVGDVHILPVERRHSAEECEIALLLASRLFSARGDDTAIWPYVYDCACMAVQ